MDHIRVVICRVGDTDEMMEVAAFDVAAIEVNKGTGEQTLNELENRTQQAGNAIVRQLFQEQWALIDRQLTETYEQEAAPGSVRRDGHETLTVATRFGRVELARQVCVRAGDERHVMPGNLALPDHQGLIITRGLQEWACLLSQDLSFASATRLLGWQTQDPAILGSTTLRHLVRQHGQIIRQAEQGEAATLAHAGRGSATVQVVPHQPTRRQPGWPEALNAAVQAALAAKQVRPPQGVSWADWTRVLAVRQTETSRPVAELRQLGPTLAPGEVLVTVDEVLTRQPTPHHFWELRTARLMTAEGYRYVSGTSDTFLQQLLSLVLLAVGTHAALLLIADGARWIRRFFTECLAEVSAKQLILDWYHLLHKCKAWGRQLGSTPAERAQLTRRLARRLWQGQVDSALRLLERCRKRAQDIEALDRFIAYLQTHRPWIPNYRQRRLEQRYIGSAHAEKANDLLVARRQKVGGRQWSLLTSDSLAALRTLTLNRAWDAYWQHGQVLPLAAY